MWDGGEAERAERGYGEMFSLPITYATAAPLSLPPAASQTASASLSYTLSTVPCPRKSS